MDNFTIGFSRPKKWKPFSWLIMKGYGIPYSHVYIKFFATKYNRFLIYQASSSMVNFMNPGTFQEEAEVVFERELQISPEARAELIAFAIDNCGKPYGVKECFGLAIVRIAELFGKEISNPFDDDDRTLVCSELAAMILRDCVGMKLPKDPDDMTPKDMYEFLSTIK